MSMNDEIRLANEQIESVLASFTVTAAEINRGALMYQAGYAAACSVAQPARGHRFWQATTGLMTAATVALAVLLARQDAPTDNLPPVADVEQSSTPDADLIVATPAVEPGEAAPEAPDPQPSQPSRLLLADPSSNYLALRAAVLQRGVETWPTDFREPVRDMSGSPPGRSRTVRDLLMEVLPTTPAAPDGEQPQSNEASTSDEETIV